MVEIFSIGGYDEVGKNMSAVKIGDDVILLDAGIFLPAVIDHQESETERGETKQVELSEFKMRSIGAIPDDLILDNLGLRNKVRALLIGHAHLDHVGAVPFIAPRYKADVVGTPFTIEVLKQIMNDSPNRKSNQNKSQNRFQNKSQEMRDIQQSLRNPLRVVQPNSSYNVKGKSKNYQVEFLNMTHSTPQTALMVVHTPEGAIVYSNDYKLDNSPVLGNKPNYEAMKRLSKTGVKALIIDSLYASDERKTPSEKIARDLVEEVLLTVNNENKGIIVSTFSSHIARLKSVVDFSKKLDREIVFLGRSLGKYVRASIDAKICPFEKDIKVAFYKKQVESMLKKVNKNKDKYVVVCTGHQGEPGSILDRIARKKLPYDLSSDDNVIFASKTIPVSVNIANKGQLDKRLKKDRVRIFDNVHVSGHGGREDARDLIKILNPEHVIPSHGDTQKLIPMIELCKEMGYKFGKNCHLMQNSQKLKI